MSTSTIETENQASKSGARSAAQGRAQGRGVPRGRLAWGFVEKVPKWYRFGTHLLFNHLICSWLEDTATTEGARQNSPIPAAPETDGIQVIRGQRAAAVAAAKHGRAKRIIDGADRWRLGGRPRRLDWALL
jgi:hypothetical protein